MADFSENMIINVVSYEHISKKNSFIPFSLFGELIKTKQSALLVYTGMFTYLISGFPNKLDIVNFILLVIGLFFSISGTTLLTMYIDKDVDALMNRTKQRAIPSGKIKPRVVLLHGFVFTMFGIILTGLINYLTMFIIFLGFFFNVIIYSLILKRRTRLSIIFGGIAGGLPAVAGRTAVTNNIDILSILFLFFILSWIPLHILTLSVIPDNYSDYQDAGIPIWPVVAGKEQTMRVIAISAILNGLIMILIGYFLNLNIFSQLPLIGCGLYVIHRATKSMFHPSEKSTLKLFKLASMFMLFTFIWLFLGLIITDMINH